MAFDISAFGVSRERLPCGWVARRIDALALFNPEQINSGYSHSHIAYLDISNVGWGAVSQPTLLPLSDAPSRAKRIVRSHDVILSTVRPGNRAYAFIKEAPDNLIVSTGFAVLRAKQGTADARFVYYLTTSDPIIHYLASIAEEKTAYPSVNPIDIGDCIVPVPPLPEQCAIAHILGTLDDKIELNRRMNDTLEAMARALFKSWFVDFDPVIDNALAAGNPIPGALAEKAARRRALSDKRQPLPDIIRRLFPDRFVDSELGPIPEGWGVGTLGSVANHPRRGVHPSEIDPGTPYIALEHMPKRCIALSEWGTGDDVVSNKFEFKQGEILFGKLRPYFHKVGIAPLDGVCSTDIVVVAPSSPAWFGFVLGHASSPEFVEYANAGSSGTKMPRTNWRDMACYEVALPSQESATAFTNQIHSSIERIACAIHDSHTIAALRDTLLPKLISGELRVKDAGLIVDTDDS